jgi:hypothetical protein
MLDKMKTVLATAFVMGLMAGPAFAALGGIKVPEPATLSVFAAGGGGALAIYLVGKWFKRK